MRGVRDRFRRDTQLRLATLTAVCLLAEAVVAKNVLEVRLDPFSQIAPFWVYLVSVISGEVTPQTERAVPLLSLRVAWGLTDGLERRPFTPLPRARRKRTQTQPRADLRRE